MSYYQPFNMCPFTIASVGGGGGIGFDIQSYTWTHSPCMETNCKLWTYKVDSEGKIYAEGCHFEFLSLSKEEILRNKEIKEEGKKKLTKPANKSVSFKYYAKTAEGTKKMGYVQAVSRAEATIKIQEEGLVVIELIPPVGYMGE